ncbi:MAG: helix-turn-helix domain-containing protein [Candidatus Aenigmatarchaeota archaeon]
MRERLARDIVSEVVLSDKPEDVIKKWRSIFKISQKRLAGELGITPSVVSDYESGRRKSPGINIIKRYVEALIEIDASKGGNVVRSFGALSNTETTSEAIIDIREMEKGVQTGNFCRKISAEVLTDGSKLKETIYGYTVIDSIKAITEFSFTDLVKLYGETTQRALIFTKVSTGKSPMVALKLTNLKPGLVVLHGPSEVDEIAIRIAEVEGIPLAVCRLENIEDIVERLKRL